MAGPCRGDPVVCIDFVILFVVEFLKDWTTLAMLAVLLALLLRLRADRQKADAAAYVGQIGAYEARLNQKTGQGPTWVAGGDRGDRT